MKLGQPVENGQEASAVVDSADNIHVVSGDWKGGQVLYTRWDGLGWSEPLIIGKEGAFGRNIAVDSANHPWVVWSGVDVRLSRFDGAKWLEEQKVQANAWHPDIVVDGRDNVHLVFNDGNFYPSPSVRPYHVKFSGLEWSRRKKLTEGPYWSGGTALAIDSKGTLHIVFISSKTREGGSDSVYYVRFIDGEWQRPFPIGDLNESAGQTGKESPAIGVDKNDVVYVVWRGRNAKAKRTLFFTALRTDGWTQEGELIDVGASDVSWPSVGAQMATHAGVDVVWNAVVGKEHVTKYMHIEVPQSASER